MRKKFKDLKNGEKFMEVPDEYGHAFIFPFEKILARAVHIPDGPAELMNAKAGNLLAKFGLDEEVEAIDGEA